MFNCLIVGVGGQGIVLASKVIAQMAIDRGEMVRTAETIGMAQRGGSVFSHIRCGEGFFGPLIGPGGADLLIGFEPGETVRCLPFLRPGGKIVSNNQPLAPGVKPEEYEAGAMVDFLLARHPDALVLSGKELTAAVKNVKVLNIALLGAAIGRGYLPYGLEAAKAVIAAHFPEKLAQINIKALEIGAREGTRRDDE